MTSKGPWTTSTKMLYHVMNAVFTFLNVRTLLQLVRSKYYVKSRKTQCLCSLVAACTNAACGLPAVPRGHCERESRDLKRCGWRRAFYGEEECSEMEKQLSGSAKRKLKRKKELKLVDNLKHLPKIANYFTPNQCPLRKGDGNAEIPPSPVVAVEPANVTVSDDSNSVANGLLLLNTH